MRVHGQTAQTPSLPGNLPILRDIEPILHDSGLTSMRFHLLGLPIGSVNQKREMIGEWKVRPAELRTPGDSPCSRRFRQPS